MSSALITMLRKRLMVTSVEAQILRISVFNQRVVNDARKVTVFLKLRLNEDMATNGRYPLVVTNYEERFE